MKRGSFLIAGLFFVSSVIGQEAEADSGESKPSKLTVSGFADVYYSYNFNDPGLRGNWGTNGVGRIFDGEHNQIAFNMIQTKIAWESDKLEVVGDLLFGPGAELANFGNAPLGSAVVIKQAYMAYGVSDNVTFTIGQFGTHIGYELVDAPDNFHYSLSYLFGNGPFYHTGAKLDFAISDKIGFMVGVMNGWDNLIDDNLGKSIAAQVSLTPSDDVGIYLNWIGGNEAPSSVTGDSLNSYKHMGDVTASFAVSEKFNVGVNAAFGFFDFQGQSSTNWGGAALYLDYAISDHFALGLRSEYFDDVAGTQYVGASYIGYTLTGVITTANEHLYIKPEFRFDSALSANSDIYFTNYNNEVSGTDSSQMTVGIAFIAKF